VGCRIFIARCSPLSIDPCFEKANGGCANARDGPIIQAGRTFVAWCWSKEDERYLVAVNRSDCPAQARIHTGWNNLAGRTWNLTDKLSGTVYERSGDELQTSGHHAATHKTIDDTITSILGDLLIQVISLRAATRKLEFDPVVIS
jgi:hypothetical protein